MRKISCLIPLAAMFAVTMSAEASAQAMFREQKVITTAGARAMVDACTAYAEKNKQVVAMAVLDWAGNWLSVAAGPTRQQVADNRCARTDAGGDQQGDLETLGGGVDVALVAVGGEDGGRQRATHR